MTFKSLSGEISRSQANENITKCQNFASQIALRHPKMRYSGFLLLQKWFKRFDLLSRNIKIDFVWNFSGNLAIKTINQSAFGWSLWSYVKQAEYKRLGLPLSPTTTPVVRKDTTTRKLNLKPRLVKHLFLILHANFRRPRNSLRTCRKIKFQ